MLVCALALASQWGHLVVNDDVTSVVDLTTVPWLFNQGDDLAWAASAFDDRRWEPLRAGKGLGAQYHEDLVGPYWYRLHVHAAAHTQQLAVELWAVDSAYEIYANGKKIGARGSVVEPFVDDEAHPGIWPIPAFDGDELVIAIRGRRSPERQSSSPSRGGLNHKPDLLGPTQSLANDLVAHDVDDFILIGGFLIAGLYHLELFRRRRAMKEYFWFALFALLISGYVASQCAIVVDVLPQHDKVSFLLAFLALPTFLQFIWVFLREPIQLHWRIWQLVNGAWTIATMAWPSGWLVHRFLVEWEALVLAPLMFGTIALIARRVLRGDPEAKTVALGALLLVLTSCNNVLRSMGLETPELTNYAFAGFVLVMAVSLSNRFTRAYAEIDALLAKTLHLSKLKEQFLANTSHELRTPLNTIINLPRAVLDDIAPRSVVVCGACGVAFEGEDDVSDVACPSCGEAKLAIEQRRVSPDDADVLARHMQNVIASGEQLMAVVNDIFDASKIASGQMELHKERVAVVDVVARAIEAVRAKADARGVRVVRNGDAGIVSGDRERLVQIFVNLVDNAVKFSPAGGVVDVEMASGEIRVIDRGPGISQANQATIFDAFVQVDASHTRKHGGTGLGLAIVKSLVEMHGGTIRVESAVGRGSTFIVRLPLPSP